MYMDITTWSDMICANVPISVLIGIGSGMQMTGVMLIMLVSHVKHKARRANPIG
jgi:hypothetical protein